MLNLHQASFHTELESTFIFALGWREIVNWDKLVLNQSQCLPCITEVLNSDELGLPGRFPASVDSLIPLAIYSFTNGSLYSEPSLVSQ